MTMNDENDDDPAVVVKIAIVYPGDADARRMATPENNRFASLFAELARARRDNDDDDDDYDGPPYVVHAEPAVYHPSFVDDVRRQLLNVDAALVWVNPIEGGCDRAVLDGMLREVSNAGVYVSGHPDVIDVMGTKDVLVRTRTMPWGIEDTSRYDTVEDMRAVGGGGLASKLTNGERRVLKRNKGQSGSGVWLVERHDDSNSDAGGGGLVGDDDEGDGMRVRVRHAERGSVERIMSLGGLYDMLVSDHRCLVGGDSDTAIIDMAYQDRLHEGMVRAYMVHDRVCGFGHQAINALHPTSELPDGHPRMYYPPHAVEGTPCDFQPLRAKLEREWMPMFLEEFGLLYHDLPVMWDADFMFGPRDTNDGSDTYVLCEINMSCVSPYPEYATPLVARAVIQRALIARSGR
jgi:hypothetical protein